MYSEKDSCLMTAFVKLLATLSFFNTFLLNISTFLLCGRSPKSAPAEDNSWPNVKIHLGTLTTPSAKMTTQAEQLKDLQVEYICHKIRNTASLIGGHMQQHELSSIRHTVDVLLTFRPSLSKLRLLRHLKSFN